MTWHVEGTYAESCNCDPICPCRRIDGRPRGRSTYGLCLGALSWLIEDGQHGSTDLSGLKVAIASSHSDDEAGSPWSIVLYLDERADPEQQAAARADLPRPRRWHADRPLPAPVEAEPRARRAAGADRDRPHPTAAVVPRPRRAQRPHPRPGRRSRDRHLRHPRARAGGRGARRGVHEGRGHVASVRVPRELRLRRSLRLSQRGLASMDDFGLIPDQPRRLLLRPQEPARRGCRRSTGSTAPLRATPFES